MPLEDCGTLVSQEVGEDNGAIPLFYCFSPVSRPLNRFSSFVSRCLVFLAASS